MRVLRRAQLHSGPCRRQTGPRRSSCRPYQGISSQTGFRCPLRRSDLEAGETLKAAMPAVAALNSAIGCGQLAPPQPDGPLPIGRTNATAVVTARRRRARQWSWTTTSWARRSVAAALQSTASPPASRSQRTQPRPAGGARPPRSRTARVAALTERRGTMKARSRFADLLSDLAGAACPLPTAWSPTQHGPVPKPPPCLCRSMLADFGLAASRIRCRTRALASPRTPTRTGGRDGPG